MKESRKWAATRAPKVRAALERIGWRELRCEGSHRTYVREGWPPFVFAYHDRVELPPGALRRLARRTGLRPEDL